MSANAGPRLAVGVDMVEIPRVVDALARHPERFLTRHFTAAEVAECHGKPERLATRWAAKEAAAKALGTGIGPVGWHEIEVVCASNGAPSLRLTGRAADLASRLRLTTWRVSLSHTEAQAVAFVVAVGE